jgi:5'-deoxynucleotidase YfbR-like HD superfamily hydrolase
MAELWHEYEAAASPEARLVKDFDKLEMILQVCARSKQQCGVVPDAGNGSTPAIIDHTDAVLCVPRTLLLDMVVHGGPLVAAL